MTAPAQRADARAVDDVAGHAESAEAAMGRATNQVRVETVPFAGERTPRVIICHKSAEIDLPELIHQTSPVQARTRTITP